MKRIFGVLCAAAIMSVGTSAVQAGDCNFTRLAGNWDFYMLPRQHWPDQRFGVNPPIHCWGRIPNVEPFQMDGMCKDAQHSSQIRAIHIEFSWVDKPLCHLRADIVASDLLFQLPGEVTSLAGEATVNTAGSLMSGTAEFYFTTTEPSTLVWIIFNGIRH